jgi:hypothetical protein
MSREYHLEWFDLLLNMHLCSYFVGEEVGDLWCVHTDQPGNTLRLTDFLPQAGLSVGSNVRGSILSVTLGADAMSVLQRY